jgi:hypothetical protein
MKEKFTISVTGKGLRIIGRQDTGLEFSAAEALMLLDILRDEEKNLRAMADNQSPAPLRFDFGSGS